jgi:hypothetical protein
MRPGLRCLGGYLTLVALSTIAYAQGQPSVWDLNGSNMYLSANGARREFRYHIVRPGLEEAGVQPGTLWFQGTRNGDQYVGTAYVFSKTCGALPYAVTGSVSADGQTITISGSAPFVGEDGCVIEGYRPTSDELHLVQSALAQAYGKTESYGDNGKSFSEGKDDYFLLSRTGTNDAPTSGYIGQVRVVHHFEGGGYEIILKDYSVTCNARENSPSVIWYKAGDHSTHVTISVTQPNRHPKQAVKESYNLYWAACFEKFGKYR